MITALYALSLALFAAGIVVFVAFRNDTVEEARGRLRHGLVITVSWPGRFIAYRSGHGAHAM